MFRNFIMALFLFAAGAAFCQDKQDNVWMLGYGMNNPDTGFGGTMVRFDDGNFHAKYFDLPPKIWFAGTCSISDSAGNLQFYTSGCRVFNAKHELLENGEGLNPGLVYQYNCENIPYFYPAGHSLLAIPKPGHAGRYFLFHADDDLSSWKGRYYYSEIDMNENGGAGKVILKNEILQEPDTFAYSTTAVRHGNGRDWWVVFTRYTTNTFYVYRVSPEGISMPDVQQLSNGIPGGYFSSWDAEFSPDGSKYFRIMYSNPYMVVMYNFDRCSGQFSDPHPIALKPDTLSYSPRIAVSPNSRYLYVQSYLRRLYQYDLEAPNISASVRLIGVYDGFRTEQSVETYFHDLVLAPDGKIYMCSTNGANYLHAIHRPDLSGDACQFEQHGIKLPTATEVFLPVFPNFRLYDLPGSICDTLGIDVATKNPNPEGDIQELILYPNPASSTVTVQWPAWVRVLQLEVLDMPGRVLYSLTVNKGDTMVKLDIKDWPAGPCLIKATGSNGEILTKILIVQ